MKKHLSSVCGVLLGIAILYCSASAETATPNATATHPATSTPLKTIEQNPTKALKDCDDEWRADKELMMKHDMTEESYVEQCSAADDVPAIPSETKTNDVPPAAGDR